MSGSSGDDGSATKSLAELNSIYAVAVDTSGNIYIADTCNHIIRKIQRTLATSYQWPVHLKCPALVVMVGQQQNSIYAVVVDVSGNVYFADTCNHIIQKIIKCSVIYIYTIVNPFMPGVSTPFMGSN